MFGFISLCARVWHSLNVLTPPYILILTFGLVDDFDERDLGFVEGFNLEENKWRRVEMHNILLWENYFLDKPVFDV